MKNATLLCVGAHTHTHVQCYKCISECVVVYCKVVEHPEVRGSVLELIQQPGKAQ